MSQRTADELEFRRGMVLGLTLAEVLLLLLFILILALASRLLQLQRDVREAQDTGRQAEGRAAVLETSLAPLSALLAQLKVKGELDISSLEDLATKLAKIDAFENENANLKKENSELKSRLGSVSAISSDPAKLKALNDVIGAAVKINAQDPVQVLSRAIDVLKALGPDIQPSQISNLSELVRSSTAQKALEGIVTAARRIDPNDPVEALTRALDATRGPSR